MKKKYFLAVLFLFTALCSRAQFIGFAPSEHVFIEYEQGFYYPDFTDMNTHLQSYNNVSFGDSLRTWGINIHAQTDMFKKIRVDADFAFRAFTPHLIRSTDSLSYRLSGWLISYNRGRDVFPGSNFLDLILGIGYDFGRFKMIHDDLYFGVSKGKYTNPAFLFHGQGELRFNILKQSGGVGITLGIKGIYTYDVTSGKWKSKTDSNPAIGFNTKMTGYMLLATLGFAFHSGEGDVPNEKDTFNVNDRMPDK